MKKTDSFTLKNGLRVVVSTDTDKHYFFASIMTLFGGLTKKFKVAGKEYNLPDGVAHLMEHLQIDKSIYGNMYNHMKEKYVDFNGTTNDIATRFYIDTVENYEENLVELIKMVNTAVFTEKDLEDTKKPIYEEIKKYQDGRFRNVIEAEKECLFQNINVSNTLGTIEEIKTVDYKTVKLCHDVFYQPSNQILALCGNIDIEKIKSLVEKTYDELSHPQIDFEVIDFNEPEKIKQKEKKIIDNDNEELVSITFKLKLKDFTPYEKVKMSFYMNHFLTYNFNDSSKVYKYMQKHNYVVYSIEYSAFEYDDFLLMRVAAFTNHVEEFKKQVLNVIHQLPLEEDKFEIWKKRTIVQLLLREEMPSRQLYPYLDNIIVYNYYEMDKVSDIDAYTIEDYKNMLKRIDFSNFVVVRREMDANKKNE